MMLILKTQQQCGSKYDIFIFYEIKDKYVSKRYSLACPSEIDAYFVCVVTKRV